MSDGEVLGKWLARLVALGIALIASLVALRGEFSAAAFLMAMAAYARIEAGR